MITVDISSPIEGLTQPLLAVIILGSLYVYNYFLKPRDKRDRVSVPPYVRSFIPFIGSAIEMGTDPLEFNRKYFKRFQSPIFTATIGGKTCHFLSASEHVSHLDKHPQIDRESTQKQFAINCLTFDMKKMGFILNEKSVLKKFVAQYHKYLFTREGLNHTVGCAQQCLNDLIKEVMNDVNPITGKHHEGGWKEFDLYEFVSYCVYHASVQPLLSKELAKEDTRLNFFEFDKKVPLLHSGVPSFFFQKANKARGAILDSLASPEFSNEPSELMKERLTGLRSVGLSNREIAKCNLGVQFASVGNSIPGVFWLLYHILKDREAYKSIQSEVDDVNKMRCIEDPSCADEKSTTIYSMDELDLMPLLESAFKETLRLSLTNFAVRDVNEDFVLDLSSADSKEQKKEKFFMKKGTTIMCYIPLLHRDEEIFRNADNFVYSRFSKDKSTKKEPIFTKNGKKVNTRYWGGGAHLCPGRKFINYETQAFVACLMTQYDMDLVDEEGRSLSFDKNSNGVGVGKPDRNVYFRVMKRKERH